MKKSTTAEITAKLNKALWASLTGKNVLIENHCDKIFLLRNQMTDLNIDLTMDGNGTGRKFNKREYHLLALLSSNIGNIFYLAREIDDLIKEEDYETCEILKISFNDAIKENMKLGRMHPDGISFFYQRRNEIHQKFINSCIMDNLIMHKCGILLDLSINTPDFLKNPGEFDL